MYELLDKILIVNSKNEDQGLQEYINLELRK